MAASSPLKAHADGDVKESGGGDAIHSGEVLVSFSWFEWWCCRYSHSFGQVKIEVEVDELPGACEAALQVCRGRCLRGKIHLSNFSALPFCSIAMPFPKLSFFSL